MAKKVHLKESALAPLAKKGNRWLVVIAAPGEGNSGKYTRQILAEQGPVALPAGTKSWIGHALPQDRDPRDLLGRFPEGAYYKDDLDPEKYPEGALVAELDVRNTYKQMIEEIAEQESAELSLFMDGEKDHNGVVTSMIPDRWNSVDLVGYGGITGAGLKEKLYESFSIDPDGDSSGSASNQKDKKEGKMDPETKAAFDALLARLAVIETSVANLTPVDKSAIQAEVNAEETERQVAEKVNEALAEYEGKLTAIEAEKDLLPAQVESLRSAAREGKDITPLIESARVIAKQAKDLASGSIDSNGVRLTESASSSEADDFKVTRW